MNTLDTQTNYIVSGLERSGTSMMMQILHAADLPIAFDDSRKADESNPKGYYELEGGKIINKLMENTFPIQQFQGQIIKITAFGLSYLPPGSYKIIYMERNIDEVLDSMEKMAKTSDENREDTKQSFLRLNAKVKQEIQHREDIDVLYINYNQTIAQPHEHVQQLCTFLNLPSSCVDQMKSVVDNRLYRQRR